MMVVLSLALDVVDGEGAGQCGVDVEFGVVVTVLSWWFGWMIPSF